MVGDVYEVIYQNISEVKSYICLYICLPFAITWVHPRIFGGVRVAHLFFLCVVLLCVFTFRVPHCDVRYEFRIKTMFGSSLPTVACRRAHVLFALSVFACLSNTYCGVLLFYDGDVQHVLCCVVVLVLWCPTHIVLCCCFSMVMSNTYCVVLLF